MAKKPSKQAHDLLLKYARSVLDKHKNNTNHRTKLEAIDIAYVRLKRKVEMFKADGTDINQILETGDDSTKLPDNLRPPIVSAQVDSAVAYLSEVFLSDTTLFPVISTPRTIKDAEQLEALIDNHAILGGYARQFLLFFKRACKYNCAAIEASWENISSYEVAGNTEDISDIAKVQEVDTKFTRIKSLDPYNTFFDTTVDPGDVSQEGEFAGYVEIVSHTKLLRILDQLPNDEAIFTKAAPGNKQPDIEYYQPHPQLSAFTDVKKDLDWTEWFSGIKSRKYEDIDYSDKHEVAYIYCRLVPNDFNLQGVPNPGKVGVFRLTVVDGKYVVHTKRLITPQGRLPIFIGQPVEDGLKHQTQGVAESTIPIQEAATTLFDIKFNAARRAVMDRGIYNSNMVDPDDINSMNPAAKIPAKVNSLVNQTLDQAYKPIPFEASGLESTMRDAIHISEWASELTGQNNAMQGQFQKGNKTGQEFNAIMGNAGARQRMPALTLEHQVFIPIKQFLKMNIFMHTGTVHVTHQATGNEYDVNIRELRKKVLNFRLADGFTPKSKMANTETLTQGLTLISTSPVLQQVYGNHLPMIFAHLMSLGGVKGLEAYSNIQGANNGGNSDGLPQAAGSGQGDDGAGGTVAVQ